MNWIISKSIEFAYGHRVHTQKLNGEYSADLKSACRHCHGHEGKVDVFLTADTLDNTGMITDFRHLEWFKKWINEYVDHRFILDKNDPLFNQMIGNDKTLIPVMIPDSLDIAGWSIDLSFLQENTPEFEYFEGFLIVDFVPTSENLSKWVAGIVGPKMKKLNVDVQRIEWNETPKSKAVFIVNEKK